jgi:hypothetical protein
MAAAKYGSLSRYAEGVAFGRCVVRDNPKAPTAHRALAINLALGGGLTEARDTLRTLKDQAQPMTRGETQAGFKPTASC